MKYLLLVLTFLILGFGCGIAATLFVQNFVLSKNSYIVDLINGSTSISKTCDYNGMKYSVGDSFKDSDNCNTCSCSSNGQVVCTLMACIGTNDTIVPEPKIQSPDSPSRSLRVGYDNNVCWNRVISQVDSTKKTEALFWPNGCGGINCTEQSLYACTESIVKLSDQEVSQYNNWVNMGRQELNDCACIENK